MRGRGYIRTSGILGFCAGVERAVSTVEKAVADGRFPVRVLHEIVHNEIVVEHFRKLGVEFHDSIDPSWKGGVLIFSAHGVDEKTEREASLMDVEIIDATCPLVKQVHRTAAELENMGYSIIFIGSRKHRETAGVVGRLKVPPVIVESQADAEKFIPDSAKKYACLCQTTLETDFCEKTVGILKIKIPSLLRKGSVCCATSARQNAVKKLAALCPKIIVLGSPSSSNSCRLREVAELSGADAVLVASPEMIPSAFLEDECDIGIAAGASAPEELVTETIKYLERSGKRRI